MRCITNMGCIGGRVRELEGGKMERIKYSDRKCDGRESVSEVKCVAP